MSSVTDLFIRLFVSILFIQLFLSILFIKLFILLIKLFMSKFLKAGAVDCAAAVAGPVVDEAHVVVERQLSFSIRDYPQRGCVDVVCICFCSFKYSYLFNS